MIKIAFGNGDGRQKNISAAGQNRLRERGRRFRHQSPAPLAQAVLISQSRLYWLFTIDAEGVIGDRFIFVLRIKGGKLDKIITAREFFGGNEKTDF